MDSLYKSFTRESLNDFDGDKLEFMVREWHPMDRVENITSDDENSDENSNENSGKYSIFMFGVNKLGESVCLRVNNFTPYFYVKIPDSWSQRQANVLAGAVKSQLWSRKIHLLSHKIMTRKDAYGFNNLKQFKFIRFVFDNHDVYKRCQKVFKYPINGFEKVKFKLYETSIDPMLVFIHLRDIEASGWINVDRNKLQKEEQSRCQHNYSCNWKDVCPSHELSLIPPMMTMSFDLECYSHDGNFPDPKHKDNYITQVGSSFQKFGSDETLRTVIVVGKCDPVPGAHLIVCKTEKELIKKWVELVAVMDPDQIIGYNIDSFDWNYLWYRSQINDICDWICEKLPRLDGVLSEYTEKTLESAAYGFNKFDIVTTPGVGQMDLLHWFRKNTKLDKYTLDFVSETYLAEKKREVSVYQIFKWSGPEGTPSERALVADYCVQDTNLPLRLMENRCMLPNLVEMSRVTYVPLTWLITRGEQVKAYSQINRELRKLKFVLPGNIPGSDTEYEGATVLNCDRGFHGEPVSGLDFASLYPSIMIAWNLCPTTWVADKLYLGLENTEYKNFQTEEDVDYTFVQSTEGVVPGVLSRLWKERKRVKKLMGAEKDPRMKAILNGKQLAIKVSMNSIYGFFGVKSGVLPCRSIAASVTFVGREMIKHSKECAETWYDGSEKCGGIKATVIYGDSVTGDTPLVIRTGSEYQVTAIKDFQGRWKPYDQFKPSVPGTKEQISGFGGEQIMTSGGWSNIRRVIRHKCVKEIYRVTTEKGTVFVTADHSLLDPYGVEIKPENLNIGETLMCADITNGFF
jgi:DNA polymerase delta subunit 1